jgi:hypothetical protein
MSKLQPNIYDCCINSCICYIGPQYVDLVACLFCNKDHHDARGQARQKFTYILLIPRLQAFLPNVIQAKRMHYRAEFKHINNIIKDIFDDKLYCFSSARLSGLLAPARLNGTDTLTPPQMSHLGS